jgi:hypothetical protein
MGPVTFSAAVLAMLGYMAGLAHGIILQEWKRHKDAQGATPPEDVQPSGARALGAPARRRDPISSLRARLAKAPGWRSGGMR